MKRFFGTDDIAFSTTSPTAGNAVRTFTGFRHAARDNGVSRIYVGFHFRFSVQDGLKMGRRIGRFVVQLTLRPVPGSYTSNFYDGAGESVRSSSHDRCG